EFFDLCFTGFRPSNRQLTGGQTGGIAAVRPAGARRSDWRRRQVWKATLAVRPEIQHRSDRRHPLGQTGRSISVRPTSVDFEVFVIRSYSFLHMLHSDDYSKEAKQQDEGIWRRQMIHIQK
ncbi:Os09g0321000, partial [Oryza sativa Japonica Group]